MADDKDGRENQASNEERRQRERALAVELERYDEPEPQVDEGELGELERALDPITFPATGEDIVAAVGDQEVAAADGTYTVAELVPAVAGETFEEPSAVTERVARPTVATAMKRVVEAAEQEKAIALKRSQRDAYEKTFRALAAIDAIDDDEGIGTIADWATDQIREKGKLPGSRALRREAGKVSRAAGYEVRNDEWLGV